MATPTSPTPEGRVPGRCSGSIKELSILGQQSHYASSIDTHSQKRPSEAIPSGLNYRSFHGFVNPAASAKTLPSPSSTQTLLVKRSLVFIHKLPSRTRPSVSRTGLSTPSLSFTSGPALTSPASSGPSPSSKGVCVHRIPQDASLSPDSPLLDPTPECGQLLFIRGFVTNHWVKAIGSFYQLDPEYFRKHLDFLSTPGEHLDLPHLPSVADNIGIRLQVTDIFRRPPESSLTDRDVQRARRQEVRDVRLYQKRLGTRGMSGETVVRRFSVLDRGTFSTEHAISVTIKGSVRNGWTAVIWSDTGHPLNHCPQGPWSINNPSFTRGSCIPTTVYRPNAPFIRAGNDAQVTPDAELCSDNLFQSASLVPEIYSSTQLIPEAMRLDAFYALSDLFAFVATSEKQFLNSMELRVKDEIYSTEAATDLSVDNLKYSKELLDSHAQNLEEVLLFLRNRDSSKWPTIPPDNPLAEQVRSKHSTIVGDFAYLLSRAQRLAAQCLEGVTIITNGVMLQESRKAIDMGEQTKTVTLLAFFYLPLTLATSFFGMNFKELGQGGLTIWIGIGTAVGLVILQVLTYKVYKDAISRRRSGSRKS
ncbi:hypothetical protein QBC39DRAFT_342665 [Podospora conica]|nr:hypothetical protein QBC39DRAFT_342665 [Schizothecium conicum]